MAIPIISEEQEDLERKREERVTMAMMDFYLGLLELECVVKITKPKNKGCRKRIFYVNDTGAIGAWSAAKWKRQKSQQQEQKPTKPIPPLASTFPNPFELEARLAKDAADAEKENNTSQTVAKVVSPKTLALEAKAMRMKNKNAFPKMQQSYSKHINSGSSFARLGARRR